MKPSLKDNMGGYAKPVNGSKPPNTKSITLVPHTKLCEIMLGWAKVCDCGADLYNKSLKESA